MTPSSQPQISQEDAEHEDSARAPLAIAASMLVMLAGAAFLSYAISVNPASTRISPPMDGPSAHDKAGALAPSPEAKTIADLIEQAEAVGSPADINVNQPTETDQAEPTPSDAVRKTRGAVPQLNPRRALAGAQAAKTQPTTSSERGFAPRLKPKTVFAGAKAGPNIVLAARPITLGGVWLAEEHDRPVPVFFASDLQRRPAKKMNLQLADIDGDLPSEFDEVVVSLSRGENFVDALRRAGVRAADRNSAAYAFGKHHSLRKLRPGQEFRLVTAAANKTLFQLAALEKAPERHLLSLDFRIDSENKISVKRLPGGDFTGEKSTMALTTRLVAVEGRINGSLYLSAKQVGAPDKMIGALADVFSYDVDFQRDIFGGDEFEAIFEVRYDEAGNIVGGGDIIYARLKWRGRTKEKGYYRFSKDGDDRADYYDRSGQSAKRLLMKTPIDGARLSSGFGTRKHPVLGYRKAHKGVDFAARRGTPIKAAGDGVVERANRYGSFGNYIRIRHSNGYKTAYAHLKGFRKGIRAGKRVRQGDIIGYVGTTGRSTGPHLHYEVHLKGRAVNPQRLKIKTTGVKLTGARLDRFKMQRDLVEAMRAPAVKETPKLLAKDELSADSL